MRTLLLLIILLLAGAWFYPPYAEGTENACSALEKRMSTLAQAEAQRAVPAGKAADPRITAMLEVMKSAVASAQGAIAQAYIREKFPQLPPSVGCVAGYWKFTVDPDLSQFFKGKRPV